MKNGTRRLAVMTIGLLAIAIVPGASASASRAHRFRLTRHGIHRIHIGERIGKAARHTHGHIRNHCGIYREFGLHRYKGTQSYLIDATTQFGRNHRHIASLSLMANQPRRRTPVAIGPHEVRLGMRIPAAERHWGHAFHRYRIGGQMRYWIMGPGRYYTSFDTGRVTNAHGRTANHRIRLITMSANRRIAFDNLADQGGC